MHLLMSYPVCDMFPYICFKLCCSYKNVSAFMNYDWEYFGSFLNYLEFFWPLFPRSKICFKLLTIFLNLLSFFDFLCLKGLWMAHFELWLRILLSKVLSSNWISRITAFFNFMLRPPYFLPKEVFYEPSQGDGAIWSKSFAALLSTLLSPDQDFYLGALFQHQKSPFFNKV